VPGSAQLDLQVSLLAEQKTAKLTLEEFKRSLDLQ
jgi:hypothetical protein